ncbi:hypothetical protein [uncultured Winogradskyella sp.]|uniref:hypothetical protein n=1 Tax=uncultured Winogradskyella sp. TaxID=395353 RepID=UPI00260DEF20|nr:hypothetical protein [uncultured Winogradskyella sp.]
MIKRLVVIISLTGLGHIVTLLSLKFISTHVSSKTIAFIGNVDSLTLILISIIAFGLQLSATRNMAISEDWKKDYYLTQSARLTLSLLLFLFGISGFFYTENYLFFLSPILALNADFALYGRGKPIAGAFVALVRILIPSLALIFGSVYYPDLIIFLFVISLAAAYLVAGIIVTMILDVRYFVKPKLGSLVEYYKNINIGVATFAFMFLGIGIVNVASYIYNDETMAIIYIALKLYMIFKGVRRLVVQSFFKELQELSVSIKVDYFAIIAGILFFAVIVFYPKVLIPMLFDKKFIDYRLVFTVLGAAGFISSFTTSSGTRLLLRKDDKQYSVNIIIAASVVIISSITLWFIIGNYPVLIAFSVLLGEITVSVLNAISLKEKKYLKDRLSVSYAVILFGILFFVFSFVFGQTLFSLLGCLLSFGVLTLIYTKKMELL